VREYYDTRAPEYDEWYLGIGRFAGRIRPDWDAAVAELETRLAALPPAATLDVACGTVFLTRHLRGEITGLDQSERMITIAHERVPTGTFVVGDALALPFDDDAFDRLFTGHFYGHLEGEDRERFLAEARRVADEVIIVDSATRPDHTGEERQQRILNDGSRFEVYKRYFDGPALVEEIGGGSVLLANDWFVMVSSR
jgi:ubiquinone/menaquinone biosynthesis C-methylase UbiE